MQVIVLQRKDLHIFCYHDLSLYSLYNTRSKIIFPSSLFAPFVSVCIILHAGHSYYSPCGPLGITPSRYYYRNAKLAEFGYSKHLILIGTRQWHIRFVWSRHRYFGSTTSRQNTNNGSTKLARYEM